MIKSNRSLLGQLNKLNNLFQLLNDREILNTNITCNNGMVEWRCKRNSGKWMLIFLQQRQRLLLTKYKRRDERSTQNTFIIQERERERWNFLAIKVNIISQDKNLHSPTTQICIPISLSPSISLLVSLLCCCSLCSWKLALLVLMLQHLQGHPATIPLNTNILILIFLANTMPHFPPLPFVSLSYRASLLLLFFSSSC